MPIGFTITGNSRGISLIEMMIAMLIGMLLLGGVYRIFISTTTSYRFEEELSNLQENGRFAMEFLTRDTRQTGYRGCAGSGVSVTNTLNAGAGALFDFDRAVEGYDDVADPNAADFVAMGITPIIGSDVLILRKMDSDVMVEIVEQMPDTSADIKITGGINPAPIADFDIVMVSDCQAAAVFQVTNYTDGGGSIKADVVHNSGVGSPGNATKDLGHSFGPGAEIAKMTTYVYFIGTNADGEPGLYYKVSSGVAQEIVGGIESMQITYGIDADSDRDIDSYVTAAGVADWATVLAVRVGLLVASMDEVLRGEVDAAAYTLNGTNIAAANDRRLRQVFTTTVALRNRLP
ncbi:type IV pilus minor pilin PilW [Syntrophotalea carbinolica DSM 2380]|uniref:Type IV pilus minor pilin PilW n=2 Tax=Syntrophotalea carbinolica TaxID=19 RepID=Q3A2L1_SYNC1|nr:type IV pilus minor pilin PilW [Syntrophotalea carbinolica DSM 2380]